MDDSKFLILGANGQVGTALSNLYPNAKKTDVAELDITDVKSVNNYDWGSVTTILNGAAYTNVDGAETPEGRVAAWKVNAIAVTNLSKIAIEKDLIIVHISTDYVFDGSKNPHTEDELFSPLSVYGASKAAGDAVLSLVPKHYLLRTSWVIGEGPNFVRTMLGLGQKGVSPAVVADQTGRPAFTEELVKAVDHLLKNQAPYGTYNFSNEGEPVNWAEFTREIFKEAGYDLEVKDTTTEEYFASKPGVAARPLNSVFDLTKLKAAGFTPRSWNENLKEYIKKELVK